MGNGSVDGLLKIGPEHPKRDASYGIVFVIAGTQKYCLLLFCVGGYRLRADALQRSKEKIGRHMDTIGEVKEVKNIIHGKG